MKQHIFHYPSFMKPNHLIVLNSFGFITFASALLFFDFNLADFFSRYTFYHCLIVDFYVWLNLIKFKSLNYFQSYFFYLSIDKFIDFVDIES